MKYRLWTLCIVLAMLFALAFPTFAAEEALTDNTSSKRSILEDSGSISWTNPIFEGEEIDENTVPDPSVAPSRKMRKTTVSSVAYEAESFEDACIYMREKMKERTNYFEFVTPETTGVSQDELEAFLNRYLNEACKVTEVPDPLEGDYIRANLYKIKNMSVSVDRDAGTTDVCFTILYCSNADMEAEMIPVLEELVDSFGFDEETSDLDKICTIYDYICKTVTYDDNTENLVAHSAYAALIDHTSVCQGYASLFYRLALTCGLKARYVSGVGIQYDADGNQSRENHGWNIVKLGDYYYNMDATWDATQIQGDQNYCYFMRGSSDFVLEGHDDHIAGQRVGGKATYIPEECALLSEDHYKIPTNHLAVFKQNEWTISIGRTGIVGFYSRGRVNEVKDTYSFTRYITFGNGYSQSGNVSSMLTNVSASSSNRAYYDGMKMYWTITMKDQEDSATTETVTVHIIDGSEIIGYSLVLGDEISVNIYMDLSQEVLESKDAFVHLDIPGTTRRTEDVPIEKGTKTVLDGQTYYVFSAGVAAKDMTQDLKISCYLDENTVVLDEKTVTIREYGDIILDPSGNYPEKAKTAVKALLNYGTCAQEYFDYHTDNPANSNLTAADRIVADPDMDALAAFAKSRDGEVTGLKYKGTRLVFRTKTLIWHYFQLDESAEIEDYVFTINGRIVMPEAVEDQQGWYVIKVEGVPAKLLYRDIPLTVRTINNEESMTVHYSAYSYVNSLILKANAYGEKMIKLVKSLYAYGEAARDYFG